MKVAGKDTGGRSWQLLVVSATAVLGAAASLEGLHPVALRAVLAAPLVFFLPGYAFVSATTPVGRLPREQRLLAGIGVSVALAIAAGLCLDLTPGGLQRDLWAAILAGATVLLASIAWWRRRIWESAGSESGTIPRSRGHDRPSARWLLPWRKAAAALSAAVITATALAIAVGGATHANQRVAFTQLWMLPAGGTSPAIDVGVWSHETTNQAFRLELRAGGRIIGTWRTRLRPGQQWDVSVQVPAITRASEELTGTLYVTDDSRPYRHVDLPPTTASS